MFTDTCMPECKFYKKYKNCCPFFLKLGWKTDKEEVYFTNDCSHKRSVLMLQEVIARNIALQSASEQERNAQHLTIKQLAYVAQSMAPQMNLLDVTDAVTVEPTKLIEAPKG